MTLQHQFPPHALPETWQSRHNGSPSVSVGIGRDLKLRDYLLGFRARGAHGHAVAVLLVAVVAVRCAPALDFDDQAKTLAYERRVVVGTQFSHAVYAKAGSPSKRLHVYLGSDGTPWLAGRPAVDPTPRDPLMLRLMARDPAPAVYLGRPCYHGLADDAPCAPWLWTTGRYSEDVVASLAGVVRRLMREGHHSQIVWFGYSGGGTLAVLLAPRFRETVAVATLAANLDTDAWAAYAWGGDLSGSLNPADRAPLPPHIRQRHYAGGADRIVPPHLTAPAASRLGADLIVVEDYDHVCCWERSWPGIVQDVIR